MTRQLAERPVTQVSQTSADGGELLNQSAIERSIVRERLRCDRRGIPMATVEIRLLTTTDRLGNQRRRLTRLIQRRLRLTDQIGRLNDDRLLLVLPDTDRNGAERLRDEIFDLAEAKQYRINARISIYPPDEQASDGGDWTNTQTSHLQDNWQESRPEPYGNDDAILCTAMPFWKRLMDLFVAISALIVLAPLMLVVAVLIKLTSPGPVLFRQWRDGLGGQPFVIFKFRTMQVDAEQQQANLREQSEQDGPAFKLQNDPRVTWIGRFLRKSCIDELPQLFNIVRGEMSLVGPRPLPCTESRQIQSWQARRMSIRPGLTCYWQALRTTEVAFVDWMRLDLRYANRVQFTTDLVLIVRTALAILGLKKRNPAQI